MVLASPTSGSLTTVWHYAMFLSLIGPFVFVCVAVEALSSGQTRFLLQSTSWSAVQKRAKPTFLIGHNLIENERVIVSTV